MRNVLPRRLAGFTLIEVMIVVAIVAILSAIAFPSYQESVRKSKRADARTQLLEVAQFMQRFYSQNDRYDQANDASGTAVVLPAALTMVPRGAAAGTAKAARAEKTINVRFMAFSIPDAPIMGVV